ncbi:MAG: NADH-quinone oxidoreductase subunit F [Peptococcaceae bacterium]|nr:NADH-quinone oxidoreductase subunit F [Peptococcaceae bacterium]
MSNPHFWEELRSQKWSGNLSMAAGKIRLDVNPKNYRDVLAFLEKSRAILLTMAGTDERPINGNFGVYTVFYFPDAKEILEIALSIEEEELRYPSATPIFASAHWLEREIRDMLGIIPDGHPDLRRLAVHPDWPEGLFPLRKDFVTGTKVPRVEGQIDFCTVEGEGIYQIPVGPIHAGIIEPGHFRFYAFGEDVINLQAQLFYTHRGIEKEAEGKHFSNVMLIAERICGACSVSHALAYAQAVESLTQAEIPERAKVLRTILSEMERLYNHIGDIGNMCAGIGFALGISRGAILKEKIMRQNMNLFGHRYLRGTIIPGGVKKDLPEQDLCSWLDDTEAELKQLTDLILSSNGLLERMQTTGVLHYEDAWALGAVGPAARAAGLDRDLRRDLPYAAYQELSMRVPLQQDGDVYCRLLQRIEECGVTFDLLRQALNILPQGELSAEITELPPYQTALGWTESARGANVHWIMSGENNTIYRYMVRSASHCNWPVLPLCVPGNIVPDFPLINKSFELCYACLDR